MERITPRTLTKELRYLEMNKLVTREVVENKTVAVEYRLTEHGKSLKPLIAEIVAWGAQHRKIVLGK